MHCGDSGLGFEALAVAVVVAVVDVVADVAAVVEDGLVVYEPVAGFVVAVASGASGG